MYNKKAFTLAETRACHPELAEKLRQQIFRHPELVSGSLSGSHETNAKEEILNSVLSTSKHSDHCFRMTRCACKKKAAFTLAETIIVLVILGVIASITIPAVVRRQMEAQNRAKIKKSMTVYDTGINKIVIENQLKSDRAVQDWAGENCENSINYFKVNSFAKNENGSDNTCRFRTSDGVWWDISDILNPKVALKEKELDDDAQATTFTMSAEFDQNGSLRVNDRGYNPDSANVKKLWNYVLKEKTQVCYMSKQITSGGSVYEYNSQGKQTAYYHYCDGSGNNCRNSDKYEYDGNGNQTANYSGCDGSGNNCSRSGKYEYDGNGNMTAYYYGCDGSGNNCSSESHYKYAYDENGNMTASYSVCDGNGNNCSDSTKYTYDKNGNKTLLYYCDGNGNNCRNPEKYEYDRNGNPTANYSGCDGSGNNCSRSGKYEYDGNGNMTAYYYGCDGSGNNCSDSYKYEYDGNGNQTAFYGSCDGSGNNCQYVEEYQNTYVCE